MRISELAGRAKTRELKLKLNLLSDLHIGAGTGGEGWIDRSVIRGTDGFPYIPGSHLKGVVRDHAEQIRDIIEPSSCRAPKADNMCPRVNEAKSCLVCKIFGNPQLHSSVIFSDLTLANEIRRLNIDPALITNIRNQVSIDRRRHTSKDGRLFNSEVVPLGTAFSGSIKLLRVLEPDEEKLLQRALKLTDRLGANKSVGLGNVQLTWEELTK